MLTADLVDVRRSGDELVLRRFDPQARAEATALAAALLESARAHLGLKREELDAAWEAQIADAKRPRVAKGLRKLLDDACVFESGTPLDPLVVRREVFTRAAAARKAGAFERATVVVEAGESLGIDEEKLERALFADLRGEHVLRETPPIDAASLVDAYEVGRAQAVLLRAVRVVCEVHAASPGPLRAFFAKMKFLQLLYTIERLEGAHGGFRLTIDGPFSMFESVTKYGLRLASVVPALHALERWTLAADLRWGKERSPLSFRLASSDVAASGERALEPHLSDEVRELMEALRTKGGEWEVEPSTALLDAPGLGVCIPDLVLRRGGEEVFVEVLGYWSRDAVFRRVQLAERGLGARVVFAASSRLRVSEEVMGDDLPAALYVYKGKMSARALLERVERVAAAR